MASVQALSPVDTTASRSCGLCKIHLPINVSYKKVTRETFGQYEHFLTEIGYKLDPLIYLCRKRPNLFSESTPCLIYLQCKTSMLLFVHYPLLFCLN